MKIEPVLTIRRKKIEILSDNDISQQRKTNNHLRKQGLYDAINKITIWIIYIAPIIIFILSFIVLYHLIVTQDWETIIDTIKTITKFGLGYLVAYLQRNGLESTDKE